MLAIVIPICFSLLCAAFVLCIVRVIRGPLTPDRALALDTASVVAMAIVVVYGVWKGSKMYFDVALVLAVLSYVSTVAIAKYMLRGDIIE